MNFASDNVEGAAPEILAALEEANHGAAASYGSDPWTARLEALIAEIFEKPAAVFPIVTGSAANALALACLTPPWGAVYCEAEAHINVDECGAPEFFTQGAKLVPLPGQHGKISPAPIEAAARGKAGVVHHVQPACISLTQATEAGTVYSADEVAAIGEVCRRHGLGLHMDGARFANALAALGCAPADITWRAGVDILCLGATKNGALAAEAILVFDAARAADLAYRRKRGGHLLSKMRFVSAQLVASLEAGRWLDWAGHANRMARRLADGLAAVPGVTFAHPVEINAVFARFPDGMADALRAQGFVFYGWPAFGPNVVRLMTSFRTSAQAVDQFVASATRLGNGAPVG